MTERVVGMRILAARLVLTLAMWWLGSARAHAQHERPALAHLDWYTPSAAGCMPARDLEREVEALLDRDVFTARSGADQVLIGQVEQRGDDWVARLQLQARTGAVIGTREVVAPGACASLNRPLVIVISTLLDITATEPPGVMRLGLGVTLQGNLGLLPRPGAGASLLANLQPGPAWPALRLQLGGFLPRRETSAGAGASFAALRAGLSACPSLLEGETLSLIICAGLEAGAMRAQAFGLGTARRPVRMLASLPLELDVSWRLLSRLALLLGAGVSLELLRPAFYFEDAVQHTQVVHKIPSWSATARFGFIVDVL